MKLGVIGGSSLVTFDPQTAFAVIGLQIAEKSDIIIETTYGNVNMRKFVLTGDGHHTIFFIQRHSHGADGGLTTGITPPHKINHRANIRALADVECDMIVGTSSVGTLRPHFPPGRVGVCRQYIDFTGIATTYHDESAKFTSVTTPYDTKVNAVLVKTLRRVQALTKDVKLDMVTWLTQGPQYETEAEVTAIERMGGDVVGMTSPREAKLAAELGVRYSCLAIASNWAAGRHPGDPNMVLSHEEVSEVSKNTTTTIVACLVDVLKYMSQPEPESDMVDSAWPSPTPDRKPAASPRKKSA